MDETTLRSGVHVTLTFAGLLMVTQYWAALVKGAEGKKARKAGTTCSMYHNSENLRILRATRGSMNLLEWSPIFFAAFWSALAVVPTDDVAQVVYAGWIYVGVRAVYPVVVANTELITFHHVKHSITLVTLPAYLIILFLGYKALAA